MKRRVVSVSWEKGSLSYGGCEQGSTLVWILLTVIPKPPGEINVWIRLMLWTGKKREGTSLSLRWQYWDVPSPDPHAIEWADGLLYSVDWSGLQLLITEDFLI